MQATRKNPNTANEKFTLELSFIEMHIILKAMESYSRETGYGAYNTAKPNLSHAEAAEELHESLLEIYCKQ